MIDMPAAFALAFWSALTAAVYAACRSLFLRTRQPVLHPGFTGIVLMVVGLAFSPEAPAARA